MRRLLPVLASTLALGGCLGGRPQIPPAAMVAPPPGWRSSLAGEAAIDPDWWRAFGDPRLDALVRRALANNSDIGRAAASVLEARARLRAAQAKGAGACSRAREEVLA